MVVTQATPIQLDFCVKEQQIKPTFYAQRYDRNDFAKDAKDDE